MILNHQNISYKQKQRTVAYYVEMLLPVKLNHINERCSKIRTHLPSNGEPLFISSDTAGLKPS